MKYFLIALLVMSGGCALLINSVSMYTEFTPTSRSRGCMYNQNSIDKCMGVWESQNVELIKRGPLWIELDTRGRIARVSPELQAIGTAPGIPAQQTLRPGSSVLFDYSKDMNIFTCPERANRVGAAINDTAVEVEYRWMWSPDPIPELGGRRRGAICLFHHSVGPRDDPDARHSRQ